MICSKNMIANGEQCQIKCDFGYEASGNYSCTDGTIRNTAKCQSNMNDI